MKSIEFFKFFTEFFDEIHKCLPKKEEKKTGSKVQIQTGKIMKSNAFMAELNAKIKKWLH